MIMIFTIPILLKDKREIKNIPKHFRLPLELLENAGIPCEFVSVTLQHDLVSCIIVISMISGYTSATTALGINRRTLDLLSTTVYNNRQPSSLKTSQQK